MCVLCTIDRLYSLLVTQCICICGSVVCVSGCPCVSCRQIDSFKSQLDVLQAVFDRASGAKDLCVGAKKPEKVSASQT